MKSANEIPSRITVQVPLKFVTRGGRKAVFVPASDVPPSRRANHNNALIKALVRANRWRKLIEDGEYSSITELADATGTNQSYACQLLRMTLLSPEIVTDILNGKQCCELTLTTCLQSPPLAWSEQRKAFRVCLAPVIL